jgi:hypothetical protein
VKNRDPFRLEDLQNRVCSLLALRLEDLSAGAIPDRLRTRGWLTDLSRAPLCEVPSSRTQMGVKPLDRQVVHAATTFAFSLGLRQTGSVVPRSRYAFVPNASKKAPGAWPDSLFPRERRRYSRRHPAQDRADA